MYGSARQVSPGHGNQSGGAILSPLHPDCNKHEPCKIPKIDNYVLGHGRGELLSNSTYDECWQNIRKHHNYYGQWVRNGHWKAAQWVPHKPHWFQTLCRAVVNTVCDVVTWVTDTAGCLLNSFSPTVKCQTARMRMELKNDQPVRYRRTARYGKKADGHINVIPGRWTPAFGCVDDTTGKSVPLKNIMFGHNEQQKATDWRTKENNSNNPGPIWLSHGWGDQMGLTSVGFVCPEGSHYKRVGKKDMPYSDSLEPAREWSSENHPGHQDNSVFLPEYRHAGMYNSMMTTGFPDMYQLCSSIDNSPSSTPAEKRANIDDWGKNCGWYFEGYRRRTNTISKVDGDMSTGGAWSEIDLGVWSRDLNARDRCFDTMKNRSNEWNIRGVTNKIECENKGGTWIASGSKEVKFWGYGDICVKSCSEGANTDGGVALRGGTAVKFMMDDIGLAMSNTDTTPKTQYWNNLYTGSNNIEEKRKFWDNVGQSFAGMKSYDEFAREQRESDNALSWLWE